jgi:hypothetical protein
MNYHVWQRRLMATVHSQLLPPAESVCHVCDWVDKEMVASRVW